MPTHLLIFQLKPHCWTLVDKAMFHKMTLARYKYHQLIDVLDRKCYLLLFINNILQSTIHRYKDNTMLYI